MKLSNEGQRLGDKISSLFRPVCWNNKFKHVWEVCQVS
jgi:hypothetical protein